MAKIAIISTSLGGHIRPAIRLGAVLAHQGHTVLIWAGEAFRIPIQEAGCAFHPLNPIPYPWPFRGPVGFAATLAGATADCVEALVSELLDNEVELVVHDDHAPWGRVAADFLRLPRIASSPLFPNSTPLFPSPAQFWSRRVPPSSPEAELALRRSRDAIARRWGVDLGPWHDVMVQNAPRTISYTTAEISGQMELQSGWRYVGPLMGPAPARALPSERPLVYVAFGTYFSHRSRPFEVAIEALAEEPVDVLVATGAGMTQRNFDLGPLPENTELHGFVRSREVLARASVHITHGGCGSVHESLLAGVPMVCLPQGSDHWAWCQRVRALGAGRIVEPNPADVRTAVRELLGDEEMHARTSALGRRLEEYDGEGEVAIVLEQALARPSPASAPG